MPRERLQRIGLVGGYGAVGEIVARELDRSTDYELVIGGRNLDKATAFAGQLRHGRPVRVDVFQPDSVAEFCAPCGVVVNCASPSFKVLDRVARGALAGGCHYVDPFGIKTVLDGLLGEARRIEERGLVYLFSVGYVPGVHEVFMRLVASGLDVVDEVRSYVQDRSVWSEGSSADLVNALRRLLPFGEYRHGVFTPVSRWDRSHYDFPPPFGRCPMIPRENPDVASFARESGARRVATFLPADAKVMAFGEAVKLLPEGYEEWAAKVMRPIVSLEVKLRGGEAGVMIIEATGQKNQRPRRRRGTISFTGNRGYWMTSVPNVIATRMIVEGQLRPGLWHLGDAVEPTAFMDALRPLGVDFTLTDF
jgi:saccharopine dehydrogenase (NAD+, L-lysine-forming)